MSEHSNVSEFQIGSYNGVSIVYRTSDKYVNASRLCSDGKRDFRTFKRSDKWRRIIEYWNQQYSESCVQNCTDAFYELMKGYPNEYRGQYVHPNLVHFVAEWISIEYAFKVAEIMNLINERNQ